MKDMVNAIQCLVVAIWLLGIAAAHAATVESNNIQDEQDELLAGRVDKAAGVAGWQVSEPYINLWIFHQPLTYETSYGQPIGFGVAYKQRNNRSNAKVFGLGPGWESSWLTYVEYALDASNPPKPTVRTNFVALGGARNYVADGASKEFKSTSTMNVLTNGGGTLTGFQVNYPSGARDIYAYLYQISTNENYAFLSQQIDSVGHTNQFNYDTVGNVVRLRTMVDWDNRTNAVAYSATFTSQISEVAGPYGTKAGFGYDGGGRLTTITNAGGLVDSLAYDSQNLVTNLVTVYGTTSFKTTTNSFGGYQLGGTNQVNRSLLVTEADGIKQLFLYRDSSSYLNPGSAVPLLPSSYAGENPDWQDTFDNSLMDARNSFSWNQKQYAGLNSSFRSSGNFNDLTTNDYNVAVLKHWLRGYTNAAFVTPVLSLYRETSPDGSTQGGQKTWLTYQGKVSNWWTRGTNANPSIVALLLPNGSPHFTYWGRNKWEKPTSKVENYGVPGSSAFRTNSFTYSTDGIDLIQVLGPSNELLSSNAYNGFHQVVTNFNAVNDKTVYTYDSAHRVIGVQWPTGLVTTNLYFTSGAHAGWLSQAIDFETSLTNAYRTNAFTYTNGLVLTSTDARGLISTNTWDSLRRRTSVSTPAGTISFQYSKLDLIQTVLPSGAITNRFAYDAMRRQYQVIDGRNGTSQIGYLNGLLSSVTNALGQTNGFTYDFNGRQLTTLFHDGTALTNRYNLLGQLESVSDAAGVSRTNWYNHQAIPYAASNAFGLLFSPTYDLRDRVLTNVDANGITARANYDNLDRVIQRNHSDLGSEYYQYSARGQIAYTNQLGFVTRYGYDALGRKIAETNANNEVTRYAYNAAGDLMTLTDGKGHVTQWSYDQFGHLTNVMDALGTNILRYKYDRDGRLTNRWSVGKGNTTYAVDANGNVTSVQYPASPAVSFAYDALNRVTNMTDAAGTTALTYTSFGAVASVGGLWPNDTVTYSYQASHRRSGLSLAQPNASPWSQTFTYDAAGRLQDIGSPPGTFSYHYPYAGSLIDKLTLPSGAYVSASFDEVGRLTATILKNSAHSTLNSHTYEYNKAYQRTKQTRTDGSYVEYTYDPIGQLQSATGKESGGTVRLHEKFGYTYDAAHNLSSRTNNALVQTFSVDNLDQLSGAARSGTITVAGTSGNPGLGVYSVDVSDNGNSAQPATKYADMTFARAGVTLLNGTNTFTAGAWDYYGRRDTNTASVNVPSTVSYTYDANGNLTSDGLRAFTYDDENQLTSVSVANRWWTSFVYDGRNRLRIRREHIWQSSAWVQTEEVRYVYDGNLVIQERDGNNTPKETYTRGLDLSGSSSDERGGIGGLLARTENSGMMLGGSAAGSVCYHGDGNGNVTMLIDDRQLVVAKYLYDPYGNTLAQVGPMAEANPYRFSTKEYHSKSGLYYFGRRFYDPNLQRWPNRDPLGYPASDSSDGVRQFGLFSLGVTPGLPNLFGSIAEPYSLYRGNLYGFVHNDPLNYFDPFGLAEASITKVMVESLYSELMKAKQALDAAQVAEQALEKRLADLVEAMSKLDSNSSAYEQAEAWQQKLKESLARAKGTLDQRASAYVQKQMQYAKSATDYAKYNSWSSKLSRVGKGFLEAVIIIGTRPMYIFVPVVVPTPGAPIEG